MSNLNKCLLMGRMSRDVEAHSFADGSKAVNFGFVVNNKKKNQQTGKWEDEPVWLECAAFGKTAEFIDKYFQKGSQAFLEGHLKLDQWNDKNTGEKRSRLKIIVDNAQFVGSKGGERQADKHHSDGPHVDDLGPPPPNEDIPFMWLVPFMVAVGVWSYL
jgi:single-strand DNA-binding protein